MKINAVISPYIIKRSSEEKDRVQLINFAVIASALVFGTVAFIFGEDYLSEDMLKSFREFFLHFTQSTSLEIFTGLLLAHIPYIILMIVFGNSAYGLSFIIILSFIKITGLSMLNALIYSEYGLKGIEYALLVFFPGKFILILSVLIMMNFCIYNSMHVKGALKGEWKNKDSGTLYITKAVTAVLLFILSSVIDCFFTASFSSLFSF